MVGLLEKTIVPPHVLMGLMRTTWPVSMLRMGVELGIFDAMAGGGKSLQQLSQTCKMDIKAAEIFLNAFVGLGVLEKKEPDLYALTTESELYLLSNSQLFMGTYFQISPGLSEPWQHLS